MLSKPAAFAIRDGDVEDGGRVANGRVQQRSEGGIAAQRLGHRGAQSGGIIGVDDANGPEGSLRGKRNLVRHHVVGGVSLGHPLAQKLTEKNPGQGKHHQEYQSGDCEHELGLQSHGGMLEPDDLSVERRLFS